MKNINLKFKKIIIIVIILSISFINTSKSHAGVVNIPAQVASLVKDVSSFIEQKSDNITKYLVMAKTLYNTYQSSKALVHQVKNAKLSDYAQNIGSDQILKYGDTVLNFASNIQGEGMNVLNTAGGGKTGLGGGQVVTNLANYLDNVGVNELRKAVADFANPENTTPYSQELRKAVSDFSKNIGDTAAGKLVTFTLPIIARNEICSDPKLKKVIKEGEPADFTRPKPAVGNVDIDKLCNSSAVANMSREDQAVFTGLAKAGYGGEKTEVALRDPSNTSSGVIANTLSKVLSKKDAAEQTISKQVEATGLNIGQQTCFDKNGKIVKFEKGETGSKLDKFCYSMNSTVDQSGAVVKDRTAAALLAPYFSMLARAQATSNKTKECLDNLGNSSKNERASDLGRDNAPKPGNGADSAKDILDKGVPSGVGPAKLNMQNIFKKIFPSAYAQEGVTKLLDGINKGISTAANCISAASNIMNTIGSVLNIDKNQLARAVGGQDSPYGALVDGINEIIKSQSDQNGLYASTNDADKQYQLGYEGYTLDDLKTRVELYSQIRELNTQKLNAQLFAYTILRLGVEKGDATVRTANAEANKSQKKSGWGWLTGLPGLAIKNGKISRSQNQTTSNIAQAVIGFREAQISLSRSTRSLIKEMARNNYTEQQMNALLEEFRDTENSGPEDPKNQKQIADLLKDALTEKDFANIQLDWTYVPEFEDGENDPTASESILEAIDNKKERAREETRQSKALIPSTDEKEGPYTAQNTLYLRIRSWKVFSKSVSDPNSVSSLSTLGLTSMTVDLLSRYGMNTIKSLNPNTPRASAPGVKNIVSPDKIKTWSELSFCNNLGLVNNICDDNNITNLYTEYVNSLDNTFTPPENLDYYCANIETSIEQDCTTAEGDMLTICQNPTQKSEFIQNAHLYCEN